MTRSNDKSATSTKPKKVARATPILSANLSQSGTETLVEIVRVLNSGGVIAFPTDTLYGIGCAAGHPDAVQRIFKLRGIDGSKRPLTVLLPDVGMLPHYARITENGQKVLARIFPGPYCAELLAATNLPRFIMHEERRTIGVRIPDLPFCRELLWKLGLPLLTATAKSHEGRALVTAAEIAKELGAEIDLVVDGGTLEGSPSTVVSLIEDWVTVLREGRGPASRVLG